MIQTFANLIIGVSICSIFYVMLCMILATGVPALYFSKSQIGRFPNHENDIRRMAANSCLLLMPAFCLFVLAIFSGSDGNYLLSMLIAMPAPICFIWFGIRSRRYVCATIGPPLPFLVFWMPRHLRQNDLLVRKPMLLFDVWTVGLSLGITSPILWGLIK